MPATRLCRHGVLIESTTDPDDCYLNFAERARKSSPSLPLAPHFNALTVEYVTAFREFAHQCLSLELLATHIALLLLELPCCISIHLLWDPPKQQLHIFGPLCYSRFFLSDASLPSPRNYFSTNLLFIIFLISTKLFTSSSNSEDHEKTTCESSYEADRKRDYNDD